MCDHLHFLKCNPPKRKQKRSTKKAKKENWIVWCFSELSIYWILSTFQYVVCINCKKLTRNRLTQLWKLDNALFVLSVGWPQQFIVQRSEFQRGTFISLFLFCSPWLSNFIQAMSSPTHSTVHPGSAGFIMARLVFPQALGNAAAT